MSQNSGRGSSTLKFFIDWLLEQGRTNFKILILMAAISYAGKMTYEKFDQAKTVPLASNDDPQVSANEGNRTPSSLPNFNSPARSNPASGTRNEPSSYSGSSPERNDFQASSNNVAEAAALPPESAYPNIGGGVGRRGGSYGGNYAPSSSSSSSDGSGGKNPSSGTLPDGVGKPLVGTLPTPTPASSVTGGSANANNLPGAGLPTGPAVSNFSPGGVFFQVLSGGNLATGTGMQVQSSFGEPTSSGRQSGTGMTLISGMKGVLYQ